MTEKAMIPLSVIDALIVDFKEITKYDPLVDPIKNYLRTVIIPHLEAIKKEAIPSPSGHWDSKCKCMCHQDHQGLEQPLSSLTCPIKIKVNEICGKTFSEANTFLWHLNNEHLSGEITWTLLDFVEGNKPLSYERPEQLEAVGATIPEEILPKTKPLEQKIKARIKELETNVPMAGWGIERANEIRLARIDELRKLLE